MANMMLREVKDVPHVQGADPLEVGTGSQGESSRALTSFTHSWRPSLCTACAGPWDADVDQP